MPESIAEWTVADRDDVIGLILQIQQHEVGLSITLADQPDLVDVPAAYLAGGGMLPAAFPRMAVDSVFFRRDLQGVVAIREPNPHWAFRFQALRDGIVTALGATAIAVEHTGSTSVPGLAAKPVIR